VRHRSLARQRLLAGHMQRAADLCQDGRWMEAADVSRQATELAPENADAWYWLGRSLYSAGQLDEAEGALRQALRLDPRAPKAHYILAAIHRCRHDFAEAADEGEKELLVSPSVPAAHYAFVLDCGLSGQLDMAAGRYSKAVEDDPRDPLAQLGLGLVYKERGEPAKAALRYEEALRLDPELIQARTYAAEAYAQMGRTAEAEEQLRTVVAGSIEWRATASLGWLLGRQGKFEEAEGYLRAALDEHPLDPVTRGELGRVLVGLGRPDEAITEYRQAIRWGSVTEGHYSQLAALLFSSSDTDGAISCLEQGLLAVPEPDPDEIRVPLAKLLGMQGRMPEAIDHLRTVLRNQPGHVEARRSIAVFLDRMGEHDEAHSEALKAKELGADVPDDFLEEVRDKLGDG